MEGRKGAEKNDALFGATETLDFVVSVNVAADLDSDRIFSPRIALNGQDRQDITASAFCFAGDAIRLLFQKRIWEFPSGRGSGSDMGFVGGWGLHLREGFRCFLSGGDWEAV